MKRIVAIIPIIVLVYYATALSESEYDGNTWKTWTDIETKHAFIAGFWSGSNYVVERDIKNHYIPKEEALIYNEGHQLNMKLVDKTSKFTPLEVIRYSEMIESGRNNTLKNYGIYSVTSSQIVDGLDIFYEDFKNRSIKLPDAIHMVKKQIKGMLPEDVERILLLLRQGKEVPQFIVIDDEKGNIPRGISFP